MLLRCQYSVAVFVVVLAFTQSSAQLLGGQKVVVETSKELDERQSGSTCECGVGNKKRIVGGQVSTMNAYPWMVAVFWTSHRLFCGGAIINNRYILSASHCYAGVSATDIYVVLGDHDRSSPNEVTAETMGIERIIMHEQYGVKSRVDSDIALLRANREIVFRNNIQPICLPPPNTNYEGEVGIAAGWGTTKFGGDESMPLLEVNIPLIPDNICKANFTINYNADTMMCGGYLEGGKDACQGDSGGPLFLEDNDSIYDVIGIISFGRGCATKGWPGVYTRVTNFLPWIAQKTSDAVQCSRPTEPSPTGTCGIANSRQKRAVGGSDTSPNLYPWTAIIIHENPKGTFRLRCGATLISEQWVVTTARCVSGVPLSSLSILFGEHDISKYENREVQRFISSVVVHPDFIATNTITDDIALVKLNTPVTPNNAISPVCLPPQSWSSLTMEGIDGVATGWGVTNSGASSNIQQEVFLNIVTNSYCAHYFRGVNNKILCAGTVAGENICTNDFGGQLSVFSAGNQYMLVGVSSFIYTPGGCKYDAPAGFMRVTFYLNWISKTTGIAITP